jgi:TorA maturation chaperone TorD
MRYSSVIHLEKHRSDIYRAFSHCYHLPDADVGNILKLLETSLCAIGSNAISHVVMMRSELNTGLTLDDLRIQFSKLFVGPYQLLAPPYGSVYLDDRRQIMGDSTLDVVKRYLAAGLAIDEGFKNPPDHIAAELEFMHALVIEELKGLHNGLADEVTDCLELQSDFLACHIGQWIDAFSGLIIQETNLPFFRYLATATQQFIREDMQRLEQTVTDLNAQTESISK